MTDRAALRATRTEPPDAGPAWPARGPATRRLLIAMAAISAILPVGTAVAFLAMYLGTGRIAFPYTDFFAFWSYGRFVLTHPPASLYDDAAPGSACTSHASQHSGSAGIGVRTRSSVRA